MEKRVRRAAFSALFLVCILLAGITAGARWSPGSNGTTIRSGIFADDIDLSGMSAMEAEQAINAYVDSLKGIQITLVAPGGTAVVVTAGELGMTWGNPELVSEALEVGVRGNVIERYKALKDLERGKMVLDIRLSFDLQTISDTLIQKCAKYDVEAVNPGLARENGEFHIVEGQTGYALDVETSIDKVNGYLTGGWDRRPCTIALDVSVQEPKGNREDLLQVRDVLGTYTTSYTSSGPSRSANVQNGCDHVNGILLYPGEEFSMYKSVAPFTQENGYYMAGSYLNGKVVDSLGGGICQVSTTLYNAVLLAELDVVERHNHSMIVSYVEPSADAAIAESAGKDFRFVNNLDYPIYIEGYTQNKKITFTIYGKETREPGREVRYESKVLEVIKPPSDTIYADDTQPIGYIVADSAHIGYKAQLWKVVSENGVEVSRTQVNSSSYKMVPRSATVGTATSDPVAQAEILAAIGTGSIDHVKNVIAVLTAQTVENSLEIGEE